MAYKNFEQVGRLARRLSMADSGVVIHVDKRIRIPFNFLSDLEQGHRARVFLTQKRYSTEWGGWGAILACLTLLEEGISHFPTASYFTFLSGQDYPIKSAESINGFFKENNCNFITHLPLQEEKWKYGGIRRINRFYWARNRKSIAGYFFRTIPCPPRHFPIPLEKIHVGFARWALKRDAVENVLDFSKKNARTLEAFRWTYCTDEMFVHTILAGFLNEPNLANRSIHYLEHFSLPRDWLRLKIINRNGYRVLGIADYEKLKSSSALFARKFDITLDSKILDVLDELP